MKSFSPKLDINPANIILTLIACKVLIMHPMNLAIVATTIRRISTCDCIGTYHFQDTPM